MAAQNRKISVRVAITKAQTSVRKGEAASDAAKSAAPEPVMVADIFQESFWRAAGKGPGAFTYRKSVLVVSAINVVSGGNSA
mmetsp:Transcript_106473/g.301111  ORF Transcript_106473/g.301111 Transcript_106473/m.301111 type:complete len:82 (+) Transcript_106473:735-980(+)